MCVCVSSVSGGDSPDLGLSPQAWCRLRCQRSLPKNRHVSYEARTDKLKQTSCRKSSSRLCRHRCLGHPGEGPQMVLGDYGIKASSRKIRLAELIQENSSDEGISVCERGCVSSVAIGDDQNQSMEGKQEGQVKVVISANITSMQQAEQVFGRGDVILLQEPRTTAVDLKEQAAKHGYEVITPAGVGDDEELLTSILVRAGGSLSSGCQDGLRSCEEGSRLVSGT